MAGCKSCGYWIPEDAKKCAHCGADLHITRWQYMWKCISALTNLGAIAASIATCVMAGVMFYQTKSMEKQSISLEEQTRALKKQASSIEAQTQILQKNFELEYIPVVKIGAIAFNFVEYTEQTGSSKSVAMYFTIPIENKHGYAYNVKIIKKDIALPRGKYGLETPCIQGALTKRPFELSPGQIKYDQIGIDDTPANFKKIMDGEDNATLEYRIEYEALPEVRKGIYIYNYVIRFSGGRQEVTIEETLPPKAMTP